MPALHRLAAPAKLTRSLAVTGRRGDGYHLLQAEMVAVDLADELEIGEGDRLEVVDEVAWTGAAGGCIGRHPGGLPVAAGPDNLVARALALAGRQAAVVLRKRIPAGAGLGGGSSDAAAVLRWAGVTDLDLAGRLGADVPFCLVGGRAVVTGVGERLDPLPPLEEAYVVVTPPFGVSTAAVYRVFDEVGRGGGDSANDLELAACTVEPRLGRWRSLLEGVAGRAPRLAGSGASWFFPCDGEDEAATLRDEMGRAVAAEGERAALSSCKAVGPWAP